MATMIATAFGRSKNLFGGRSVRVAAVALAGAAGLLGGCVSQDAYDKLETANRSLSSNNERLSAELADQQALIDSLQGGRSQAVGTVADLTRENQQLRSQMREAQATIMDLEDRLGELSLGGIDPTTDAALAGLADRFPGLVAYDSDRSMLRFSSDLTFDSGSAQVRDTARASLNALAQVLTAPEAAGYDVLIVGHTDSATPSATTKQRHPTNMHLSAHRAISVRNALEGLNVEPGRMQAAGWGEFRPLVANTDSGNTPANRRVEIFVAPTTAPNSLRGGDAGAAQPAPSGGSTALEPVK